MKARVIRLESGSQYTDKRERITVKFVEGACGSNYVVLPNSLNLVLDDEVSVEFTLLPSAVNLP